MQTVVSMSSRVWVTQFGHTMFNNHEFHHRGGLVNIWGFDVTLQTVKQDTFHASRIDHHERRLLIVKCLHWLLQRIPSRLIPIHHIYILRTIGHNMCPTVRRHFNGLRINHFGCEPTIIALVFGHSLSRGGVVTHHNEVFDIRSSKFPFTSSHTSMIPPISVTTSSISGIICSRLFLVFMQVLRTPFKIPIKLHVASARAMSGMRVGGCVRTQSVDLRSQHAGP